MRITKGKLFELFLGRSGNRNYFIIYNKLYVRKKRVFPKTYKHQFLFKAMIKKYNNLPEKEKKGWAKVANEQYFSSRYQAFCSSFLLFTKRVGNIRALERRVPYIKSITKINRDKQIVKRIQGFMFKEPDALNLLTIDDMLE